MSSLTAKYRPRRFAEVAGQDAVKAILSRAAATDKVAPAYLFSGTRGVGKTTIARIFAKALNCEKAPTPEPCNECRMCRQANAGNAPDIVEIDAASHGRVDDVRALKEDVGYAPLEGRYKVFIIDEAHMLSTAAFNALLKTLEEPPPRVTFILASTEAHKFPVTILSRCQHYVFKMLPQDALAAHLEGILRKEGVEYEPGAVRIIARRGAGSVRDSISLLGQALAYNTSGALAESAVRACLGLAGQEVFFAIMQAIRDRDLPLLSRTIRQVLDQGLDLGFFLRELSGCWRNMFLLRQAGEAIVPELGLPAEEAAQWLAWSQSFTPAHIHACWQMTLEGQQRVTKSLEPAQSLELLLLNLACLPDLLPLAALGGGRASAGHSPEGHSPEGASPEGGAPAGHSPAGRSLSGASARGASLEGASPAAPSPARSSAAGTPVRASAPAGPSPAAESPSGPSPVGSSPAGRSSAGPALAPTSASAGSPTPGLAVAAQPSVAPVRPSEPPASPQPSRPAAQAAARVAGPAEPLGGPAPEPTLSRTAPSEAELAEASPAASVATPGEAAQTEAASAPAAPAVQPAQPSGPHTWAGFLAFAEAEIGPGPMPKLRLAEAALGPQRLVLTCRNSVVCHQLAEGDGGLRLQHLVAEYFGPDMALEVVCADAGPAKTEGAIQREMQDDPLVRRVREAFECREPARVSLKNS